MSYKLVLTNKFKKRLKLAKKPGLDITLLEALVENCFMEFLWKKK